MVFSTPQGRSNTFGTMATLVGVVTVFGSIVRLPGIAGRWSLIAQSLYDLVFFALAGATIVLAIIAVRRREDLASPIGAVALAVTAMAMKYILAVLFVGMILLASYFYDGPV